MTKFFSVFIGAALSVSLVLAQRPGPRNTGGTPPDPATMVAHRVSMLTTLLTLTDAQAAQATTIFTNAVTAESTIRTSLQTAHDALATAVQSNNSAAIDQAAATLGTLTGQLTAIDAKANAAFYASLTTDQQTKFNTLPHGGPGGGGPGPGGFGGHGMRGLPPQ